MSKRGQGEGSIHHRKSDGRWMATVSGERGHRDYFYGETRDEVRKKLKAALHNQDQGLPVKASKQRLGAYLDGWLETIRPNVRPKTYAAYSHYIRRHIIPVLGPIGLDKLSPQDVERLLARKLQEGMA